VAFYIGEQSEIGSDIIGRTLDSTTKKRLDVVGFYDGKSEVL
jgi:hypothetical protein